MEVISEKERKSIVVSNEREVRVQLRLFRLVANKAFIFKER